ncbi:MAG: hypothetical protein WD404_09460, partial [Solirubrobacterales bacterium]
GLDPAAVEAGAGTLEGSAYLGDLATLFGAYAGLRDRLGRSDSHETARRAISLLGEAGSTWARPVFLYGLDDLTGNQFELIRALAAASEVTVALPYEEGNAALAARARLLERLRAIGVAEETATEPDPENTANPLLFHLERGFGAADPQPRPPDGGLAFLRSAGERGEAEAIGVEVARLLAGGAPAEEIAIAVRTPERRGPLLASVLESYGAPTALEAELPVAATAVGGALVALLNALLGDGGAGGVIRFLRGPSGVAPGQVDWFERTLRRRRVGSAAAALKLWEDRYERLPDGIERLRDASRAGAVELAQAVAGLATAMAARSARAQSGGSWLPGEELEHRAAAEIAGSLAELSDPAQLAPAPEHLAATVEAMRLRVWSGPIEGRVRIASPYRLRAERFDHVFVASLQDGEFPRRERGGDPFLSDAQRDSLGLDPRRDVDAEERYLFHACLALPRERLFLSYRDCDENGAAEARSPLLDSVRRLLAPPPGEEGPDPVEARLTRDRDLTRVVHRVAEAPSEDELARALAAHGPAADLGALLAAAGVGG